MILADADFNTLFPSFATKVQALSSALVPVAAVLCFAGLVFAVLRFMEGDRMTLYKKLVTVAFVAIAIGQIGDWSQQVVDGVNDLVVNTVKSDPADVSSRFQAMLASPANSTGHGWWWNAIFSPSTTLAAGVASILIWLIGKTAWLIMWWSRMAQTAFLYFALSLAPLFLGMFAIDSMRGVGFKWVLGVISICIWPLGWAVADIMTDGLLQNAANKDLIAAYGGTMAGGAADQANAVATYVFVIATSVWVVFSTFAAPIIISKAIISGGATIGAALFSAPVDAAKSAASTANAMGTLTGATSGGSGGGGGGGGSSATGGSGGGGGATASAGSAKVNAGAPPTPANVNAAAATAAATL